MAQVTAAAKAAAVKIFAGQDIKVQTATKVKVKDDAGKETEQFKTAMKGLAAEHILSAYQVDDQVKIVTIDGQKYSASGNLPTEAPVK